MNSTTASGTSDAQMFLYMRGLYLGSQMAFNARRPERSRSLWLMWLRRNATAYPEGWAARYLARLKRAA